MSWEALLRWCDLRRVIFNRFSRLPHGIQRQPPNGDVKRGIEKAISTIVTSTNINNFAAKTMNCLGSFSAVTGFGEDGRIRLVQPESPTTRIVEKKKNSNREIGELSVLKVEGRGEKYIVRSDEEDVKDGQEVC